MRLTIRIEKTAMQLKKPFIISHSKFEKIVNFFLYAMENGQIVAQSEAVVLDFFNQPCELIEKQLRMIIPVIEQELLDIESFDDVKEIVLKHSKKGYCKSVICAVEMLAIDYFGKKIGKEVWELFAIDKPKPFKTPETLTILQKGEDIHSNANLVKLKLGGERDFEYLEYVRNNPSKRFILDVNQGWTVDFVEKYKEYFRLNNILFLEEPCEIKSIQDLLEIKKHIGSTKLFLDETIADVKDVEKYIDYIDGFNIKVVKFGGLINSLEAVKLAKNKNKEIMLGCFLESSLSITYAYSISSTCNYIDLDGATFLKTDPYIGAGVDDGIIRFIDEPCEGGISCKKVSE